MESNGMEWNGMEWNGMEWNGIERPFKSNIKLLGINHITFRNKYVFFAYVYGIHGIHGIHGIYGIHDIYGISTSLPKT
jgi:hypothetical protein